MASFAVPVSFVAMSPASAQTAQTSQVLPVTVVTASRYEQPIEDVVADITVIDRAEIERSGAGTINELLSRLPGIQANDVGRPSIFVRGANENMTAFYIDGVRIETQDKDKGVPPLELLDLAFVDRIEVLRSNSSDVYGAKAMGGVVQIFTDTQTPRRSVGVGFGSNGYREGNLGLSGNLDDQIGFRFGVKRSLSDGYDAQPYVQNAPGNLAWNATSLSAGLTYKPNNLHILSYTLSGSERDETTNYWGTLANDRVLSSLVASGLSLRSAWSDKFSTLIAVGTSRVAFDKVAPESYASKSSDLTFSGQYKTNIGEFRLGFDRKIDKLDAATFPWNDGIISSRGQTGASLGWTKRTGALSVQVGARHDDDDLFGSKATGSFHGSLQLSQSWLIKGGISTGYRAPNIEQTTGRYGSADVRPETSLSKELALAYSAQSTQLSATLYKTAFKDMITANSSFEWKNLSAATVSGLTLSGRTRFGIATMSGSLDLLRARDGTSNLPLNYRPDESASIDVTVPVEKWTLGTQWQAVGEKFFDKGRQSVRGYSVWSFTAGRAVAKNWRLITRLDNLTDQVSKADGYSYTNGRRWFVGLKWQGR